MYLLKEKIQIPNADKNDWLFDLFFFLHMYEQNIRIYS